MLEILVTSGRCTWLCPGDIFVCCRVATSGCGQAMMGALSHTYIYIHVFIVCVYVCISLFAIVHTGTKLHQSIVGNLSGRHRRFREAHRGRRREPHKTLRHHSKPYLGVSKNRGLDMVCSM